MSETKRRRIAQQAHNEANGITPKGVMKSVEDILEAAVAPGGRANRDKRSLQRQVAEDAGTYDLKLAASMSPAEIAKRMSEIEDEMYMAAKELKFEKAAQLRDEIHELKAVMIKNS